MAIRKARLSDISKIQVLLEQILSVHHAVRPDIFQKTGSKYTNEELEDILRDEKQMIYLYEDNSQKILGRLFLMLQNPSSNVMKSHKILFINYLCVDESARGQNIGEKLYHFAREKAFELGCYHLTLTFWAANQGAVRFYERMGMLPQEIRMETILTADEKE
ncbi:GNAT family N-acetyltransferase [Streptococcus pluranimalium]|uniref:GNAT family N-acetyltransferase n=1 Tax=Streptococcus pluranimalium TaxID=82348 RepID=UPI0039FC25A3